MRRYFLRSVQSENTFINYKIDVVYIFYVHNVVALSTNSKHTKMGGTLPVLKNEIGDFFFARLGTGSSIVTTYVVTYAGRYSSVQTPLQKNTLETHCSQGIIFHPHSSLKWMNNAALEEATNRDVLVNTSQGGNF